MNKEFSFVIWLVLILGAAFLGGFSAKKTKQPTVVGYLLFGFLLGFIASRFLPIREILSFFSEIFLIFLMFILGLKFSLERFRHVKVVALWGGVIQILLVIILSVFIFPSLGFDFNSAVLIGCAFSLSSMAIIAKIFSEKGEAETLPVRIISGWLLIQSLVILPMVFILPSLSSGYSFSLFFLNIVKAIFILIAVWFLGKNLIPKLMIKTIGFLSRELLLIMIAALSLLIVVLTSFLGLPLALGAFLAGLMMAKVSENHGLFSGIKSLRDLLCIIFFVSLGMFLNPHFLFSNLVLILTVSFFLILIKFLVIFFLIFWLGYHLKIALIAGFGLVPIGEFSFILAYLGLKNNIIAENEFSFILSVAAITILITPWLIILVPKFYLTIQRLTKFFPKVHQRLFIHQKELKKAEGLGINNHVIICGYGESGGWLAKALQLLEVPYLFIDDNHYLIDSLKAKGITALYGDPADIEILNYAQIDKAKIIIIAMPDEKTQELIVANCQTLNSKIKIISLSHQKKSFSRLKTLGVNYLIQPEFEANLSVIHRVLQILNVDKEEVNKKIKRLKIGYGGR